MLDYDIAEGRVRYLKASRELGMPSATIFEIVFGEITE